LALWHVEVLRVRLFDNSSYMNMIDWQPECERECVWFAIEVTLFTFFQTRSCG